MSAPVDFRTVFELSPNPYMVLDRELRYVTANAAYLRVTSSRLDELIGRHILEVFPHDPADPGNSNAALLRESLERVLATGETDVLAFIPYRVPKTRGDELVLEERVWSASHAPIFDAAGEVAFILQHTVDVTELYRLKQAAGHAAGRTGDQVEAGVLHRAQLVQEANVSLDAERRHLRRLFEQAPGFVCFLRGPDHVFELANTAYYQVVGHRDIIGKPVRAALPEMGGQGFYELLDRVFETGEPFVGRGLRVIVQRDPTGEPDELFLDFVYQPIVDQRGQVTGIFVQGYDITAQKRLEAALGRLLDRERAARAEAEAASREAAEANRLKDEFLATLSHELRTPLNALLGWAYMLRTANLTEEARARAAEVIERNARLQAQLVDDILDVSRVVTGKLRLNVSAVDLCALVEAAIEIVHPAADARGVVIARDPSDSIAFHGDADRLQQVLWNLLTNAVKFTPPGGTVTVSTALRDGTIEIAVEDTGVGISPEFLPYVFDRFRQAESAASRLHGGLGLGLAIVKHLVEAHGGAVTAASDGPGKGARFTVTLPLAADALRS